MRNFFLIAVISLFGVLSMRAQDAKADLLSKLWVTGSAEFKVPADQALFSFSVAGYGPTLRKAVEEAKTKIGLISKKLFEAGLKPSDLYTSNFFSGENRGGKAFLSSSKDYRTSVNVNVTIDSLRLLEEVVLTLSECEVDYISDIDFRLKNYESHKKDARAKAMENGLAKARQMAEQAGVKLKRVVFISEEQPATALPNYPNPFNSTTNVRGGRMLMESDAVVTGTSFFEKTIIISQKVSVAYEIE